MKKIWLLATLLFGSLLFAGCNLNNPGNVSSNFDLQTEIGRIEACADRVGFYLNINDYAIDRDEESEGWASFIRNGHVTYEKQWESAEDDVQCIVDMVDSSVNIEFTNHIYNGELQNEEEGKSLILVFSPTGNTKRMAGYIAELTDIELTEIIPVVPYTEEDLNWRNEESRTFKEYKDNTIRPEIETEINIDDYDTIYLWFPIWFGLTPNLILTLLENYDFFNKNVVLFCTSEHVWIEKAVEYLEPYKLNVIASHRFAQDTTKEQVQEWLESLSL